MNFKERIKLVKDILSGCSYETQKKEIWNLFEKTKNNVEEDVLCRIHTIDSYYSTNMRMRFFGFEELTDLILEFETDSKLENIDVVKFIKNNLKTEYLIRPIGINRLGMPFGHAFSLITKYIYFRTKLNFPIYDTLVFDGLKEEQLVNGQQNPSLQFFERLTEIKNKYDISFDELDKYFWVCGKIRNGNLLPFFSDSKQYVNDFLKKLNLNTEEKILTGEQFNQMIAQKLVSDKDWFDNPKLQKAQKLARSIKNKRMFEDLKFK